MHLILALFSVFVLSFTVAPVCADDSGFGAPFTNTPPAALADPADVEGAAAGGIAMDEAAEVLQDLLPAAGGGDVQEEPSAEEVPAVFDLPPLHGQQGQVEK